MKAISIYILLTFICIGSFCQYSLTLKFIFVPHPRSEDKVHLSVLPAIEKIDYSKFDMTLLGGDLTWYTSLNRTSMEYCDSLFGLGSQNTLWTLGNHDRNSISLIKEYTGKETYYGYYRDSISFLVLDTERDANGFQSTFISGEQLNMVNNVCDTISVSQMLVVLHHRLIWMIGNNDFATRIGSVGESTRQLDTTNFYQDLYPLLKKVKNKGIKVICLGGDKSKINIDYTMEEGIRFFASTMAPEFSESENDVLCFSYNKTNGDLSYEFVSLDKVAKNSPDALNNTDIIDGTALQVWQSEGSKELSLHFQSDTGEKGLIKIYTITGILCRSFRINPGETITVPLDNEAFYIIRAFSGDRVITKKIVIE